MDLVDDRLFNIFRRATLLLYNYTDWYLTKGLNVVPKYVLMRFRLIFPGCVFKILGYKLTQTQFSVIWYQYIESFSFNLAPTSNIKFTLNYVNDQTPCIQRDLFNAQSEQACDNLTRTYLKFVRTNKTTKPMHYIDAKLKDNKH